MPSWDEPAYKATVTLDATVPAAQMAISNMPMITSEPLAGGLRRVRFAASPKMSTYLLFLGIGDFERVTTSAGATEVGIVMRRGAAEQAGFALDSTASILRDYNDYFAVPYPLRKLDNVASPGESEFFGAMENWGAIYMVSDVAEEHPDLAFGFALAHVDRLNARLSESMRPRFYPGHDIERSGHGGQDRSFRQGVDPAGVSSISGSSNGAGRLSHRRYPPTAPRDRRLAAGASLSASVRGAPKRRWAIGPSGIAKT